MARELCELCHFHEAVGLFKITDTHVLDKKCNHKTWLCKWCFEDLKSLDVNIARETPSYEAIPEECEMARV